MISDLEKVSRIAPRVFRSPRPSPPPALLTTVYSLCVSAHSVSASLGPRGRGCASHAPRPPPVVFPLAFADSGAVFSLRTVTTTRVSRRPAGSSAQQAVFQLLPLVGDSLGLTGPLTPASLCASPGPAARVLAVPHDGTRPWGSRSPLPAASPWEAMSRAARPASVGMCGTAGCSSCAGLLYVTSTSLHDTT